MRAILIAAAILFLSSSTLAQQRKQPPVSRTFVPDEPQPCVEFNRLAARLDVVYLVQEISKAEYDEGVKRYGTSTQVAAVDYFVGEKGKYLKASLQRANLADFIRWYATEGGRLQMSIANANCNTEMAERENRYSGIYEVRQFQDAMTLLQAEGLLADVALEGQNSVIKALLESEAGRKKDVERYNKLAESVNAYNKAVNDLVGTVNTAMNEPKGSKIAPTLNFNYVRLPPLTCTPSNITFSDSRAYLAIIYTIGGVTPTRCE